MSKAYIVVELEITDAELFEEYRDAVAPLIAEFGGQYIVRGGAVTLLEGDAPFPRIVIIECQSREAAERFWYSDAYAEVAKVRHASSQSRIYMVDGIAN